ncbi:MAG TPA: hypothetical protein ENK43_16295 [Planctomycetes bacterium]|nr:hypothetical protein [Planctomycetota bacterium]
MPILALVAALLLGILSPAISAQSAKDRGLGLVTLDLEDVPLDKAVRAMDAQVDPDLHLTTYADPKRRVTLKVRRRPVGRVLDILKLGRPDVRPLSGGSVAAHMRTLPSGLIVPSYPLFPRDQWSECWKLRAVIPGAEFVARATPWGEAGQHKLLIHGMRDFSGLLDWNVRLKKSKGVNSPLGTCRIHSPQCVLLPPSEKGLPTVEVFGALHYHERKHVRLAHGPDGWPAARVGSYTLQVTWPKVVLVSKQPRITQVLETALPASSIVLIRKPGVPDRNPRRNIGSFGGIGGRIRARRNPRRIQWCGCWKGEKIVPYTGAVYPRSSQISVPIPLGALYEESEIAAVEVEFGVPRKKSFKATLKPIR